MNSHAEEARWQRFGDIAARLATNGYLPVPIEPGTKHPPLSMKGWPGFRLGNGSANDYRDCGTGLLCGQPTQSGILVGVDIDVLDADAAVELHELAMLRLGDGPARIGQPPKVLIPYRTATPFKKLATAKYQIGDHVNSRGAPIEQRIEVLAKGQQFVAFATHPGTKKPYTWLADDVLSTPLAGLTQVTEDQLRSFLAEAETVLSRYGTALRPARANGGDPAPDMSRRDDARTASAWVEAALADEVRAVATARPGGRNETLNRAAFSLGQLVGGGHLDRDRVERSLEDAAAACGLVRDDGMPSVRATIASGIEAGMRDPRDPPEREQTYRHDTAEVPPEEPSPDEQADIGDNEETTSGEDDPAHAKASARRAAWRGDPKSKAAARIRKQWPALAAEAQRIVDDAYVWYEQHVPGCLVEIGGNKKRVTDLDSLNKQFAILEVADNPACHVLRAEARPIPEKDFRLRLSGEVVCLGIKDDASPHWQDAAKVWTETAEKHRYRRIVFTDKPVSSDTMNLFRGLGAEPEQGVCRFILQHIKEVICAGDEQNYEAMLNLIAWQLQNVGVPSRIIVALISEAQQTGKGTLLETILLPIFGSTGLKVSKIEEITGSFNAILRGKAFVFLDEALFHGDKRAANEVKNLVATQEAALNEKFLPRVRVPIGINIWLASNYEVPVYVEEKDARYWALRVSEHRRIDPTLSKQENAPNDRYWDALHGEIKSGGLAALLFEMLHRDVSDFRPQRDVPRANDVHRALVRGGLDVGDPRFWLEESLENETLLHVPKPRIGGDLTSKPIEDLGEMQEWIPGAEVRGANLLGGYRNWVSKLRGYGITTANPRDFWKILTEAGFEIRRGKTANARAIPDQDTCRRYLEDTLGDGDGGSGGGGGGVR